MQEHLLNSVVSDLPASDAIIFADYDKGVINAQLIRDVMKHAQPYDIPIIVDPKRDNFWDYKGVTAMTPNHNEAGVAVQKEITDAPQLLAIAEEIMSRYPSKRC